MDIRKADSKGRVNVGVDGQNYAVSKTDNGSIVLTPVADPTRGMKIISLDPGQGKTTALVKIMLEPGNEDVVYVAPTRKQAESAHRIAQELHDPGTAYGLRNRFISASEMKNLPSQGRYVIDEIDGVIRNLVRGEVLAIAGTDFDAKMRWREERSPITQLGPEGLRQLQKQANVKLSRGDMGMHEQAYRDLR